MSSRQDLITASEVGLSATGLPTAQAFSWTTQQHGAFAAWVSSGGTLPDFVRQS